jgi:hypothetical protein
MGEVYEAEDTVLGRLVALKLVSTTALPGSVDTTARERMVREARAAAAFEHPNVVTVFDVGVTDDTGEGDTFLAMELVRGRPLRVFVGDDSVSLSQRLAWLLDVARALAAAHHAGLVHRDVKPDNVMIREDGRVKVLDFGIAKRAAVAVDPSAPTEAPVTALTERGSFVGTARYAAPEQLRGEDVDGRVDQFAWAVMAYELLSGAPPFQGDDAVALISQILTTDPPPLDGVSEEVRAILSRALSKERQARFDSMDEVVSALEPSGVSGASVRPPPTQTGETSARREVGASPAGEPSLRRLGPRWALAAGAAVVGLAALAWGISRSRGSSGADTAGSAAASAASASAPRQAPRGIECRPAEVSGEVTPLVRDALGVGACARVATGLALPFSHPEARDKGVDHAAFEPLEVEVELGPRSSVTLRLAGVSERVEDESPMGAASRAALALAGRFEERPLSEDERRRWGAESDASARRIERVWLKLLIGDLDNAEAAVRALGRTDPESPWTYVMQSLVLPRGGVEGRRAAEEAVARKDRLPPGRAKAVEGLAVMIQRPSDRDEMVRLFRQAYRDSPDDADVAGLYGVLVLDASKEEGLSVIERVATDFPTRAVVPLSNTPLNLPVRDPARNARYFGWLNRIFPEKACDSSQVSELLYDGAVDDARARIAACTTIFGTTSPTLRADLLEAQVAVVARSPARTIELAERALGDEQQHVRDEAARLLIAGFLVGGRIARMEEMALAEVERQRDQENPLQALQRAYSLVRLRALGGRPLGRELEGLVHYAVVASQTISAKAARLECLLALAPSVEASRGRSALQLIRESKSPQDLFYCVSLLRREVGDAAALAELRSVGAPTTRVAHLAALEVALLLEATRAPLPEIEAEYRRAANLAYTPELNGLEKIAARVRLAELAERRDARDEASKLRAEVDELFAGADPNARDLVDRLLAARSPRPAR